MSHFTGVIVGAAWYPTDEPETSVTFTQQADGRKDLSIEQISGNRVTLADTAAFTSTVDTTTLATASAGGLVDCHDTAINVAVTWTPTGPLTPFHDAASGHYAFTGEVFVHFYSVVGAFRDAAAAGTVGGLALAGINPQGTGLQNGTTNYTVICRNRIPGNC